MKTLVNRKLAPEKPESQYYSDLIKTCLEAPPEGGFKLAKIRERLKVMEKLDNPGNKIEFEDAEAKTILDAIKGMDGHWSACSQIIPDFVDGVTKELSEPKKD